MMNGSPGTYICMRNFEDIQFNYDGKVHLAMKFKAKKNCIMVAFVVGGIPIKRIGVDFDPDEAMNELGWVRESEIPKTTMAKIRKGREKND